MIYHRSTCLDPQLRSRSDQHTNATHFSSECILYRYT